MENNKKKISVAFFQRKPRSVGNYSVEYIFQDVRRRLSDKINATIVESKYESSGLFKRLFNCIQAWNAQSQVNHITGDVNYLGLFLNKHKTIQTILDCVHLNSNTGIRYKILKTFWLTIPEKRSRFITAISESTKTEILKHHACNPDKIKVIPVAISPLFQPVAKEFNKIKPVILQVGTAPNKNIPLLIDAIQGLGCHLHIIGKDNQEYRDMLEKTGTTYTYEWGLSDEDIRKRYAEADIISLVSTYEGFGMPILEGQATGRPVISSNILSMPEVAGNAAILVDPYNVSSIRSAIETLIQDDEFRNDLVRKGIENIKRFDPDRIAEQYFQLYKEIAS
ncbi:glycosyltransferase family 1 protein [Flavihumibacter sp. ZG627]|uniref:glycosyltransferase family 4 protein n=1 Tax=Flavihumibacter sp. ZG627 TaxID=1463156 RepID=UPI00057FAA03|nr:glycosyltransferase family 1 protein [Flavihumibacter sp. ZG627]KIC92272.1 hypothetical protein HY58_01605 [Flavihumibacter sp. ZG627]